MSTFVTPRLDRALDESWPSDAGTTPDRAPVPVRARVVWERAGEELLDARAARWSGGSVFVTPTRGRSRNGALGVWLDAADVQTAHRCVASGNQVDCRDNDQAQ
jgi:hypothetical protein